MKYLVGFSRLFVGSLFIVSGLIKANDALGFSYKLEEYFHESALNLPFLEPWALWLGILACMAEIILGMALLLGAKTRLTTWALLGLTLFFGWLTAYTATCDPSATYTIMVNGEEVVKSVTCVTDCGCFGDAMKGSIGRSLTPWESFAKDMILLVFLLPIFFMQKKVKLNTFQEDKIYFPLALAFVLLFSWVFTWYFPVLFTLLAYGVFLGLKKLMGDEKVEWPGAGAIAVIGLLFIYWNYNHLPVRDYRPFAVGKNIAEGMKSAEELGLNPPEYGYIYVLKNTETGEEKEMSDKVYLAEKWWENKAWEMDAEQTKQVKLQDGYEPPVHDFFISDNDGNDHTAEILSEPKIVLFIAYDISKTNDANMTRINEFAQEVEQMGIPFVGLSAGSYTDVEEFRHKNQTMFDFWSADAIMLKTVIRSNPGIVVLENGTVTAKYHHNDVPQSAAFLK
ncbi:MAG: DoxX family protein [Salibacteraceae bacterium]